jgi:hypothetical protein
MKYSNFQLTKTEFSKHGFIERKYATVDVETGMLWWKKKRAIQIYKEGVCWRELETGDFTKRFEVEDLASAYAAKKALEETS